MPQAPPPAFSEEVESPEEILVSLIMARLETHGLCVASQVCRAWRARCYMPDLWRTRFNIENGAQHAAAVEQAFARVGVSSHLDWRALHRDRCIAEQMSPGCHLFDKFLPRIPGFDSLRIMVLALLHEATERIDTVRWTIVEHLAQFGMHDMWDEADQMMTDGFADEKHGFSSFLPLNEATFTRLEQYACMYHNWHVYDFLLTKARHLVPPFRVGALLVRARMVFQDAYIPQSWLHLPADAVVGQGGALQGGVPPPMVGNGEQLAQMAAMQMQGMPGGQMQMQGMQGAVSVDPATLAQVAAAAQAAQAVQAAMQQVPQEGQSGAAMGIGEGKDG